MDGRQSVLLPVPANPQNPLTGRVARHAAYLLNMRVGPGTAAPLYSVSPRAWSRLAEDAAVKKPIPRAPGA